MKDSGKISEVRLDQRQSASKFGHWELDIDSGIIWASEQAFRLYGVEPGPNNRITLSEARQNVPESDRRRLNRALKHLLGKKEKYDLEFRVLSKPGGPVSVIHAMYELEKDAGGRPIKVIAWMEDVTEKKIQALKMMENTKKLLASENQLKQQSEYNTILMNLLECSAQPFSFTNASGKYIKQNQAFCDLVGYTAEELTKISWADDLTPLEWRAYEDEVIRQMQQTGQPQRYEKEYIHKDGHRFPVELLVQYYAPPNEQEAFFYSFITDITERKNKEAKAKADRIELERLVAARTAELSEVNRCLTKEIEEHRKTDQAVTNIMEDIGDSFIALDNQWRFVYLNKTAEEVLAGGCREEVIGRSIWEVNPNAIGSKFYQEYHLAMVEKQSRHFAAFGVSHPNIYYEVYVSPYKDGIAVYFQDATEKKKIQEEMARLDRLNLVGQMSAGISHEIRNPMTTVRGFLQILTEKEEYAKERDIFSLMISELDRANAIITEYLSLAQNKVINLQQQNLNDVIEKIIPLVAANAITEDKYIEFEKAEIPDLLLDANEIRQLLLNLVRNGLEAMSSQKGLYIKTYLDQHEVVLEVTDQGEGIPPEVLEKLGTPFFTTKDKGTGLGLAICYSIVNRHHAKMNVKSSPAGSTFEVRFNLDAKPADKIAE